MKQQHLRLLLRLLALVASSLLPTLASATIINVPPDPDFDSLGRLSPGTTVNLMEGGVTAAGISADGTTINIVGGVLGGSISASRDSRVTVASGQVQGLIFMDRGGHFTMTGGTVDGFVNMHSSITARIEGGYVGSGVESDFGSVVTIAGGSVDHTVASDGALLVVAGGIVRGGVSSNDGGVVHITGGEILGDVSLGFGNYNYGPHRISGGIIRGHSQLRGFPVELSGGVFEGGVSIFGELNVVGSDFTLDGVPLAGLTPSGSLVIERRDGTLAGLLVDGSPFAIDLSSSGVDLISDGSVITVVLVPEPVGVAILLPLLVFLGYRMR